MFELNTLSPHELERELLHCCHCKKWVQRVLIHRPFSSLNKLLGIASEEWFALDEPSWLEAFEGHPRIGDINTLRQKFFEKSKTWSSSEQSLVSEANESVLSELKSLNDFYFDKFGFIFIVFATGKSAQEMLSLLKIRVENSREEELMNAAKEQDKITQLRLVKLYESIRAKTASNL